MQHNKGDRTVMSEKTKKKSWVGHLFSSKNKGSENAIGDGVGEQAPSVQEREDPKPALDNRDVENVRNKETTETTDAKESASTEDQQAAENKSWLRRLTDGLRKSANVLSEGIGGIFTKKKLDDATLEDLEDLLITTDLGIGVASKLTAKLAESRYDKEISPEEVKDFLAQEIEHILTPVARPLDLDRGHKPHVILMTGVNGAGKTTTIGKLARQYKIEGKSVLLAAADTFRAAAIEQLQVWGERSGIPVITKPQGTDAAAVAFEAMEKAIADDVDVLIIDTAGRLQNREELMAELDKIVRVIGKKRDGAPHDTLIVLDATTGQNALLQVGAFKATAAITGLVMTKLDGSARGGVLVAVADKYGLPIHAIGVGEQVDDLQPFNARDFARNLVGLDT